MTTGELFSSHSTAPQGSTALYNLETLCQEGGCGEFGLIPITDVICEIQSKMLYANLANNSFEGDLQITTLNAILSTEVLDAELNLTEMNGELVCQSHLQE